VFQISTTLVSPQIALHLANKNRMFRLSTVAKRLVPVQRFSSSSRGPEVTPETKRKNALLALALLCSVGGIYFTAINKMKQTDELETVINQEMSSNKKK